MQHIGCLLVRCDILTHFLTFGINHMCLHVNIFPWTVGRNVSSSHKIIRKGLGIGLSCQGIGVMQLGPLHGTCTDAVGKHLIVYVCGIECKNRVAKHR